MERYTESSVSKRAEIYTYSAPWTIYAMNWSVRKDKKYRLAVGSFIESYQNKVGEIHIPSSAQVDISRNKRRFPSYFGDIYFGMVTSNRWVP